MMFFLLKDPKDPSKDEFFFLGGDRNKDEYSHFFWVIQL